MRKTPLYPALYPLLFFSIILLQTLGVRYSSAVSRRSHHCPMLDTIFINNNSSFGLYFSSPGNRTFNLKKDAEFLTEDCLAKSSNGRPACVIVIHYPPGERLLEEGGTSKFKYTSSCWFASSDICETNECNLRNQRNDSVWFCCCKGPMCTMNFKFTDEALRYNKTDNSETIRILKERERAKLSSRGFPLKSETMSVLLITIVPLTFLALTIIVCFLIYRVCKKGTNCDSSSSNDSLTSKTAPLLPPPSPTISLDRINVLKEIQLLNELAVRHFGGCVRKAKLGSEVVAVKIFNMEEKQSWEKEVNIYTMEAMKIGQENVLKFVGAMKKDITNEHGNKVVQYWLVTQYQDLGCLHDFLKNHTVSFDEAYEIIVSACKGLFFLHQPGSRANNNNNNFYNNSNFNNNNYNNNNYNNDNYNSVFTDGSVSNNTASTNKTTTTTTTTNNNNTNNNNNNISHKNTFNILIPNNKLPIAHRDIKSRNILLRGNLTACVADFGLALVLDDRNNTAVSQVGTRRYMSPEVLDCTISFNNDSFLKIDMYAFALVVWEVLTRTFTDEIQASEEYKTPYEDRVGLNPSYEDMQQIVVEDKLRPTVKPEWRLHQGMNEIAHAMEDTWDSDPDARLTATSFLGRLIKIGASRNPPPLQQAPPSSTSSSSSYCPSSNNYQHPQQSSEKPDNVWLKNANDNLNLDCKDGSCYGNATKGIGVRVNKDRDLIGNHPPVDRLILGGQGSDALKNMDQDLFQNPAARGYWRNDGSTCNITVNNLSQLMSSDDFNNRRQMTPNKGVVVGEDNNEIDCLSGGTFSNVPRLSSRDSTDKMLLRQAKDDKNNNNNNNKDDDIGDDDDDDDDDDDNKSDNYERLVKSSTNPTTNNNNNNNNNDDSLLKSTTTIENEETTNSPNFLTLDKEGDYLIPPLSLVKMATPFIPSPGQSSSPNNNFFNFPTGESEVNNNNNGNNNEDARNNSSLLVDPVDPIKCNREFGSVGFSGSMLLNDNGGIIIGPPVPGMSSSSTALPPPPTSPTSPTNINLDHFIDRHSYINKISLLDKAKQQQQLEQQLKQQQNLGTANETTINY